MKHDVGECDHCNRHFSYEIIHNGFNDTAYAYCDTCGTTTFVGGWDDTTKPAGAQVQIHGPIQLETEPWLQPCSCGGRFRHNASPRCPHCNHPLSADAATSYIERNAEGTRGGWRWQRSWMGMYSLIVDGRATKNNWQRTPGHHSAAATIITSSQSPPEGLRVPPRNPLLFPFVGIAISAVQAARELIVSSRIDLFGAWSIVAAASLALLYFRRQPAAGTFMFYSLVPIYPVYVIATASGWYAEPTRPGVYAVLGTLWLLGSYFAWRWKRQYDVFIAGHRGSSSHTNA